MFFLVLSITIYSSLPFSVSEQPPLCIICGCKFQTIENNYYADVTCPSKLPFDIFNVSYWENVTTSKSYKYHSLNIQKNAFGNLSTEFPPSDLVYLNLAYNSISNITTRVFRNLESLKVLILSNNGIETLEEDITKVNEFEKLIFSMAQELFGNNLDLRRQLFLVGATVRLLFFRPNARVRTRVRRKLRHFLNSCL